MTVTDLNRTAGFAARRTDGRAEGRSGIRAEARAESRPDGRAESPATIGVLLRHFRKRARLTQNELAGLSSVSLRTIRNLEGGRATNPRPDTVHLLADGLRLSAEARAEMSLAIGHDPVNTALAASLLRLPAAAGWALAGRDRELQSLLGLVRARGTRMVTLAGFAGVGKSRLAAALVTTLHEEHRTPWLWLPAEPDGSGDGVFDLWLRGLRAADPAAVDELALLIGDRSFVLVHDGADRSGPGTDRAVAALLARCPHLTVLETARRPRPRDGRFTVPLTPLRTAGQPSPGALALLLPLIRAQAADFEETPQNLAYALDVCRSLDGLPRALESAATWFAFYPPAAVARAARRDPHTLAVPRDADSPDGWIREALAEAAAELPASRRELLARLAAQKKPWTADQAAELAQTGPDGSEEPIIEALHELLTLGLIRPAVGAAGARTRKAAPARPGPGGDSGTDRCFTVLNLLRDHLG